MHTKYQYIIINANPGIALRHTHFAGAINSSKTVAPGIGAAAPAICRAFSCILSLLLEANTSEMVISLGAIPCSPRSYRRIFLKKVS